MEIENLSFDTDNNEPLAEPEDADNSSDVEWIESGENEIILAIPPRAEVRRKKRKQPAITDFLPKSK